MKIALGKKILDNLPQRLLVAAVVVLRGGILRCLAWRHRGGCT